MSDKTEEYLTKLKLVETIDDDDSAEEILTYLDKLWYSMTADEINEVRATLTLSEPIPFSS